MQKARDPSQISMTEEIIVDLFAGGGGASTGIELATGRVVYAAVNHDPDAILMHRMNHPYTMHYQASVWDVDPPEVCQGRPVGLLWASPDCRHFSKASGGAKKDKQVRCLAWVVLRWAATVRPRVIMLENVEEFVTWGPVRKGKPVKKLAGTTFAQWKRQLEALGYVIEYRELVAADYGAPTTRKRFVLVARCDGRPIVWPERTHAPADSPEVKAGKLLPWRSAAEIIDWTQPMYSIFDTKEEIKARYGVNAVRPLADNTLRRIIHGVDKFTLKSGRPFLVPTGYGEREGQKPRVHDADKPLPTAVSTVKHNLVQPMIAPITFPNTANSVGSPADQPIHTIRTGGGGGQILASANLIQYHTEKDSAARATGLATPLLTVDGSNRNGLVSAHLTEYYGNGVPIPVDKPMRTITGHDREALTAVHIAKYYSGVVGADAGDPVPTITAVDHNAIAAVHLDKYFAGGYSGAGNDLRDPVTTLTTEPRHSLVAAHIAEFKGTDKGQAVSAPLRTITASWGEFGAVEVKIEHYESGQSLGRWPEVRALLNRYCGYRLQDDEILLLHIGTAWYYISDILLRMLTPRELYNAQGFAPDYIIDFVDPSTGKDYSKAAKVARVGNSVSPPMAEAVVRANLPEWCGRKIGTMAEFKKIVSA